MISAHWEAALPTVSSATEPGMIFDYGGFPPETYQYTYPAPGDPELAHQIVALLERHGLAAAMDSERGFDHGTFVPLMLMYPQADIPVVQLSLVDDLRPETVLAMGEAIAELSQQGVLIVGSGMSFHNMRTLMGGASDDGLSRSEVFDSWLNERIVGDAIAPAESRVHLRTWATAPEGRYCHPREEHLLPLHVCFAAAAQLGLRGQNVFNEHMLGVRVSAFRWDA